MTGARAHYYIGHDYEFTPTEDKPVWLVVHNYTQRDIDKSSHEGAYKSAAFRNSTSPKVAEPVALLRYNFEYHPDKYFYVNSPALEAKLRRGHANSGNPHGLDLIDYAYSREPSYYNDLFEAKNDFRDWWMNLRDGTGDTGTAARPDGRAQLLRQMTREGIIDCIENDDVPAALDIIKNTKDISHLNWPTYRDELTPMLEARLVNHWHLMSAEQQAKNTRYVPPETSPPSNSGTQSGTGAGASSMVTLTVGTGTGTTITSA